MNKYSEEDLLMLSGIQHIAFCERQWALIHLEQQWSENVLTVEGQFLHERTDNPFEDEARGEIVIWRALPLISYEIGIYGRADVVELTKTQSSDGDTIKIMGEKGRWRLIPVEYKHGKPKADNCDNVQLCAQAMCLEEMYKIKLHEGFLYYQSIKHRTRVEFNVVLRRQVESYAERMHIIFSSGSTPPSNKKPHCKSCSLIDICLPDSMMNKLSGSEYIRNILDIN